MESLLKDRENELARVGDTLSPDGGGGGRGGSGVLGGWRASHVNELLTRVDETRKEQEMVRVRPLSAILSVS